MVWKLALSLMLMLSPVDDAFAGKGRGSGGSGQGTRDSSGDRGAGTDRGNDDGDNSGRGDRDRGQSGRGGGGGSYTINGNNLTVPDISRLGNRDSGAPYRVGFNMIRTVDGSNNLGSHTGVLNDIAEVGGQGIRQIQDADLTWFNVVNSRDEGFTFTGPDRYLQNDQGIYPIPTLFQIGPGTAAGHWNKRCPDEGASESKYCREPYTPDKEPLDLGDKSAKKAAKKYLQAVARHYQGTGVRHFEIMNEPERFKHYDLALFYMYKWKPSQYAKLLELASKTIKGISSNAKIVAGGMVYYDNQDTNGRDEMWEDYFDKALSNGAGKYIDVVNFHYYGKWKKLEDHIGEVKTLMRNHGIAKKPIWMTEVGSSATGGDPKEQARNVFRYFSVAFGNGVELVNWHTHISSHDGKKNWGGYGVRASGGRKNPSWYSYRLFASYLGNFGDCTPLRQGKGDVWAYRYSGSHYSQLGSIQRSYVLWASDDANYSIADDVPSAWSQIAVIKVVPNDSGSFTANVQSVNDPISLDSTPVLVIKR